ncbi:Leucine-zipper-like transcriptional regulator 1 [Puccinia graminis f. sp. tritici]|uniref:Leucine-zipper-like transcriptional regulator 1 n=1 Tax=Puccinia graminis f. sp. tritici TaxID=56615 RepID=A0A5B0N425_PUCGR|nr:Leucine-zipper-like transcriptional regulator 1 [Puccinia graminis f. sp. tritici]
MVLTQPNQFYQLLGHLAHPSKQWEPFWLVLESNAMLLVDRSYFGLLPSFPSHNNPQIHGSLATQLPPQNALAIDPQLSEGGMAGTSLNKRILSSFVSTGSAFVTPNFEGSCGASPRRKRFRPDEDIKRWNRLCHKASMPFFATHPIPQAKLVHSPSYHGTVIIAPQNKEAFCKAKFLPFKSMPSDELLAKNNGPHMGGTMWADGLQKHSKECEVFGRYCSVTRLVAMIQKSNYVAEDEAVAVREANDWISVHLQEMAPEVFEDYRATLMNNKLPSMAHMEWRPLSYHPLDFASFLTFTMYDFFNESHFNSDANNWTLVCWIPIFNP